MLHLILRHLILIALGVLMGACATQTLDRVPALISESEYQHIVSQNTKGDKVYDGFMNVLDLSATLLTSQVLSAQAEQNARMYQWTTEQLVSEKQKSLGQNQQTEIFLSFFVPERKHDDLQKANSKWKIFLDVAGRRVEGRATRIKALLAELHSLYPDHTRWHSAYRLSFPVPRALVETNGASLTLTGPVASTKLEFKPTTSN